MSRVTYIDVAKGMAICLMVLGHSSIPSSLSNFIWAFHMPLFFIASGFTTNWERDTFMSFVKKKVRGLLLPFLIYSGVVMGVESMAGWNTLSNLLLRGWEGYALWFIPVLFIALLCAKATLKIRNVWARDILWGGAIVAGL